MSNKERKSILSYLKNLMMHIIKWNSQEEKRSNSWRKSINNSRNKIKDIKEDTPSLNDDFIKKNWDKTFDKAKKEAEGEMQQKSKIENLTWKEVFISKYTLIGIIALTLYKLFF